MMSSRKSTEPVAPLRFQPRRTAAAVARVPHPPSLVAVDHGVARPARPDPRWLCHWPLHNLARNGLPRVCLADANRTVFRGRLCPPQRLVYSRTSLGFNNVESKPPELVEIAIAFLRRLRCFFVARPIRLLENRQYRLLFARGWTIERVVGPDAIAQHPMRWPATAAPNRPSPTPSIPPTSAAQPRRQPARPHRQRTRWLRRWRATPPRDQAAGAQDHASPPASSLPYPARLAPGRHARP
jgi:hypothetical protein